MWLVIDWLAPPLCVADALTSAKNANLELQATLNQTMEELNSCWTSGSALPDVDVRKLCGQNIPLPFLPLAQPLLSLAPPLFSACWRSKTRSSDPAMRGVWEIFPLQSGPSPSFLTFLLWTFSAQFALPPPQSCFCNNEWLTAPPLVN